MDEFKVVNLGEHLPESYRNSIRKLTNPMEEDDPSTDNLVRFYLLSRLFYLDEKLEYDNLVTAAMTLQFVYPPKVKPKSITKMEFDEKLLNNFKDFQSNYDWAYQNIAVGGNELRMESLQSESWFEMWFDLKNRIDSSDYSRLHREALGSLLPGVLVLCYNWKSFEKYQEKTKNILIGNFNIPIANVSKPMENMLYEFRTEIEIEDARYIYDNVRQMFGSISSTYLRNIISFIYFPGIATFKMILCCLKKHSYLPWSMVSQTYPEQWQTLLEACRLFDGRRYIGLVNKLNPFGTKQFGQIALIAREIEIRCGVRQLSNYVMTSTLSDQSKEIVDYLVDNREMFLAEAQKDANHRHHRLSKKKYYQDKYFPDLRSMITELAVVDVSGDDDKN